MDTNPINSQPPEVSDSEAQLSNELLVTFVSINGEEECAVVRIADTYDETLSEACRSLEPWLPIDWRDRRRDFAREIRNRKGDMIWAAVQPALVLELGRLGRLPELRLRVHPRVEEGAQLNNQFQFGDVQSPAYEAIQRPTAVDGIVQAVLHRLQPQNEDNNAGIPPPAAPPTAPSLPFMSAEEEKANLLRHYEATAEQPPPLLPSPPPPPPPAVPPRPPTMPRYGDPVPGSPSPTPSLAGSFALSLSPTPPPISARPPPNPYAGPVPMNRVDPGQQIFAPHPLPPAPRRRFQGTENNQIPAPLMPLSYHATPWTPEPASLLPPAPESEVPPESETPPQSGVRPSPGPAAQSISLSAVLQASIEPMSIGRYESALKILRSALDKTSAPNQRAKLFLWVAQIGCEVKEYHNASADIGIARELFMSLGDHSGRLQCGVLAARIDRAHGGVTTTTTLAQLLEDARRRQIKRVEVSILCEQCEWACATKHTADVVVSNDIERAKSIANMLGDMWSKAETSRVSGMVSEANGDYVTALQSYSGALELYRGATPRSPLLPIRGLEECIERMRTKLSHTMGKQSRSRFKFF